MKPDKSTSCIVRLKDGSEEKQTDDVRLFHTLTTRSAKKLLRTPLVQRGLNNLYACPLVFVVDLNMPPGVCGRSKLKKVIYIYRN